MEMMLREQQKKVGFFSRESNVGVCVCVVMGLLKGRAAYCVLSSDEVDQV